MTKRAEPTLTGLTPVERVRAASLVEAVVQLDSAIARLEALKAKSLTELAQIAHASGKRSGNPDGIDYARRAMAAEVAAATRTHPVAAKNAMDDAENLTTRFPATFEALSGGSISTRHARVIVDAAGLLSPDARAAFDVSSVPVAESMTAGELARVAKKRAAEISELTPAERHRAARERRYMSIVDLDDGMSDLRVHGPSLELHAIYDRATKLAKIVKHDRTRVRDEYRRVVGHAVGAECEDEGCRCREGGAGPRDTSTSTDTSPIPEMTIYATDHRGLDQLRTDLLIDILLGAEPTGHDLHMAGTAATLRHINADVQVTIPVTMMTGGSGTDSHPGAAWLDAGTLISPDTARHLAGTSPGWDRIFYRPDTGQIEHLDHYRPTAWQKRTLIGRDLTCRFPGCTMPARKADIDHTHAFAEGGRTTLPNLACLCEAHHVMKHQSGWKMRQHEGGVIEWTSPTGQTYETEPPSRVYFREVAERTSTESAQEPASTPPSPPNPEPASPPEPDHEPYHPLWNPAPGEEPPPAEPPPWITKTE